MGTKNKRNFHKFRVAGKERRKHYLRVARAKRRFCLLERTMSPNLSFDESNLSTVMVGRNDMEGWLRKRRRKYHHLSSQWNERYFILQGRTLSYFVRRGDFEPKGEFHLFPECVVSNIAVERRDSKKQHQNSSQNLATSSKKSAPASIKKHKRSTSNGSFMGNASIQNYDQEISRHASERKDGKKVYYTFRVTWSGAVNITGGNDAGSEGGVPCLEDGAAPPSTPQANSRDDREQIPLPNLELVDSRGDSSLSLQRSYTDEPISPARNAKLYDSEPPAICKSLSDCNGERSKGTFIPATSPRHAITPQGVPSSISRKLGSVKSAKTSPPREKQPPALVNNTYNPQNIMDEPGKLIAALEAVKKARYKKLKRRVVRGGGVVAATGAAVAATVLTGGLSLATLLTVIGISAAAGGSGAVASRTFRRSKKTSGWTLVLTATTLEEAQRWRNAIGQAIASDSDDDTIDGKDDEEQEIVTGTWANLFAMGGHNPVSVFIPTVISRQTSITTDDGRTIELQMGSAHDQSSTAWKPVEGGWASLLGMGSSGLRIFEEEEFPSEKETQALNGGNKLGFNKMISVKDRSSPLLKAQVVLDANPVDAFMCLMSHNRVRRRGGIPLTPASSQWSSFRIVETIDDHTDIIHLVFRPLFLFPSWTAPRDFCIMRYWRLDDDGCYDLCYESVKHRECPPNSPYVRGEMHGVYTIAPLKGRIARRSGNRRLLRSAGECSQCMLTYMVQTDPKGWIPTLRLPLFANQGYTEAFAVSSLLQILDVRDALVNERFVSVSVGDEHPNPHRKDKKLMKSIRRVDSNSKLIELDAEDEYYNLQSDSSLDESVSRLNYDFTFSARELCTTPRVGVPLLTLEDDGTAQGKLSASDVPEALPCSTWAEPDANSFMVRGKHYLTDKKKINAGESMLRLMAVDIVEVPTPITKGLCGHPKERVQVALQQEKMGGPNAPPFVFAMNILLPGPPHYHMMIYYAVDDMSTIDGSSGTPSSTLANKFFFGDSDKLRDNTFKLIPQIVEGNFIVRKAVGSTPAIMGNKLKQYYFSSDRYFEIFLDVASSSVAAGVVRLSLSYAKSLVVDMGFLLEGKDESTLPEKILGSCRLKNVDFGSGMRFCEPY